MKDLLIIWAIAACAYGYDPDDVQSVKSVKGGSSRYIYKGGDNISRFYDDKQVNLTKHREVEEIGVCYIEIPTIQLVNDRNHVPAGNGSRPDLSRIRGCCRGYTRNIHDFKVCDPVCSKACVNSLCVAPETCQCYPDYVKNAAGFCTPTCPIACQNGHCAGGECICDHGHKLDSESKYCVPSCKDNCGGLGNCTAPNTCSCQPGYQSTPEGSCKPVCEHCENGECAAPNRCECRSGYSKDAQGICKPQCTPACQSNTNCIAPNVCSDSAQQYGFPINVRPLYPANQVANTSNPQQNGTHYHNPYNPNYPQGPYYQYPGSNSNYSPYNPPVRSHNDSHAQEGQISQRPDDMFYPYQGPYPSPAQNPYQGNSQQQGQGPYQHPNQYPGYPYPNATPLYISNESNSSQPHRGDIDSDNAKYPQNQVPGQLSPNDSSHTPGSIYPYPGSNYNPSYQESNSYYPGGRQRNSTFNAMNQYGSGSYDSFNQQTYDNAHQGTYNGSQQESFDSRNQRTFDLTQNQSNNTSNQRSFDSSNHHSYGQQYSEYNNSYGNFNSDTQNSLSRGQYDSTHQTNYGNSNQDTQTSSNQDRYGSSQQGSYDSSRRDTQSSTDQVNYDLLRGTYGSNQTQYPYYNSQSNPRQTPEVSNQVSNQSISTNNSNHNNQEVFTDGDLQENVPFCFMPCINSYCVVGNECRCKPGYMPDKMNPNMCQPHCPGGCPNGVCSGPRLCLCNVGYYKDTSVKGRQVCVKRIR